MWTGDREDDGDDGEHTERHSGLGAELPPGEPDHGRTTDMDEWLRSTFAARPM
jgi:hypothetical protein